MSNITFSSKWHDHEFEEMLASKLRERFPQVSITHVQDATGHSIEAWKAWEINDSLDIRLDSGTAFKKESVLELTPLLSDGEFDEERFSPDLFKAVKGENGEIYGLPFGRGTPFVHALFYNADIFDKFGAPYPVDGMSWDEVIALAQQVSGEIDGIAYRGLDLGDSALLKMQLGLTFLDPITHESRLREKDCQQFFRIIREAYQIPGNVQETGERLFVYGKAFHRSGHLAMSIDSPERFRRKLPFELGVVTYPKNGEVPLVPSVGGPWILALHPNAQNPQLALEVMLYLVSEEFQLYLSRLGRFSSLAGTRFEEEYGQDLPSFKGRSMAWLFQGERVSWPKRQSPYEREASSIVKEQMEYAVRGNISWENAINTMENRIRNLIQP